MAVDFVDQVVGVVLGSVCGCQAPKQREEDESREHDDAKLAQDGLALAEVGPLAAGLAHVALDLLVAELVVDHASKGDAVAEELQTSNLRAPNHH